MNTHVTDYLLARVCQLVAERTGLVIPPRRRSVVIRALDAAARDCGCEATAAYIERLLDGCLGEAELQPLLDRLTIGETRFFRGRESFETLEQQVLRPLVARRVRGERRLRLWSAGCSTGEEAYSLAMLAEHVTAPGSGWRITVLGSDINTASLAQASRAEYGERSLREVPDWARRSCFEATGDGRWRVVDRIRRMVSFAPLNLAKDADCPLWSNASAMDLVLCRNVLIYLGADAARTAIRRLHRALVPDGWLMVSAVESAMDGFADFDRVHAARGTLFRRTGEEPGRAAVPAGGSQADTALPVRVRARAAATAAPPGTDSPAPVIATATLAAPEPAARRARAHADRGELDEALACLDVALDANPLDVELHLLRAVISRERREPTGALDSLRRALFLDPSLAVAEYVYAQVHQELGHLRDARRHLRNVRRLLTPLPPDTLVPYSDGMTAGRLAAIATAAIRI